MAFTTQTRIPAVYMRGGTSKGVFFNIKDLPTDPAARDALLLRIIGSPDSYGKQIDGMGGATSSTSKVVLLGPSTRADCDLDYHFGQVAIDRPLIDWSGNCGNLSAAVGPYAISQGLCPAPAQGVVRVRIWQANTQKIIIAHVPMHQGAVCEMGDFELDGVSFPAAEIRLEFLDPGADEPDGVGGAMFPSGSRLETLNVPNIGPIQATLINAGNPTVFIEAGALGLRGTELQDDVNSHGELLARCEAIRAHAAVVMGLAKDAQTASATRQHTPKIAFIAPAADYLASNGNMVHAADIHLLARIVSMGKLHHAMTGTGAVALAAAAAIPETLVSRLLGEPRGELRFGHPSGALLVGAHAENTHGDWHISKVLMSRSARRLMEGWVLVPAALG